MKQQDSKQTTQLFSVKNISIKAKLIILTMLSTLALSIILATISINYIEKSLIEHQYKTLTSTRDSKIKQLESMFNMYKKQINLLASTDYVKDLTIEFATIHKKFDIQTAGKFPIHTPEVQEAVTKWDDFYKRYSDTYPFEDIYIICEAHGHVMYSYQKYADFGENLEYGNYRNSGLAQIWRKVKKYKRTVFVDMAAYEPRGGEPSLFIAAPVFIDGDFKSIVVYKIKNEKINTIMQLRSGYGKTQEDYIVGSDYLMRSDSYLSSQTHSLINSFTNKESGKVKTIAVEKAFQNISNTEILLDYNNNEVLSAYTLFRLDDDINWAIISEINLEEILQESRELQVQLLQISIITFLFIMLLYYFIIQKYIITSLDRFQKGLLAFFEYVNGNSQTVDYLEHTTGDEIGIMSTAVNEGIEITKQNIQKEKIENWIKNGTSELNLLLVNTNTIEEVSKKSIQFVGNYLEAGAAVLYLFDRETKKLSQKAGFASSQDNTVGVSFELGEGIIGQVALQKSAILLTNNTKENLKIVSGIQNIPAYNTYTFPLLYNKTLYGVIEIGSYDSFTNEQISFLNTIQRTICFALFGAIQNDKVQELLEVTKQSNNDLLLKKEELENVNIHMEQQQQELEEANAHMEEQQQQLKLSEQSLLLQNQELEISKKEIQKKAEELEQSGKYKSEFLANMSHELRTPLNSVILLSSLLEKNTKKTLSPDDLKKAKTIFNSGNDLLRLINDILDLSKVESGKMEVIIDHFSSKDFLERMKDIFQFTASENNLEFIIIDEFNGIINSDQQRIAQIVRNLISNALKFTSNGSVTLKISPSKKADRDINFSVIDTGIGIPQEKQELIFKAFTQADGSTNRQYGGTGLGLSISKELSKLLGGDISVDSDSQQGSTFSIDLPQLEASLEKHPSIDKQKSVHYPISTLSNVILKDDRDLLKADDAAYLIIDDDTVFTEIVYEEIKQSGAYTLIAHTAASGIELVEQYSIKGIILDLTLPDMDGVDVIKELKSKNHSRHIPIHVISSKDKNHQTLQLGAIGYLQKPVYDGQIDEVICTINNFKEKKIKDLLIVEDDKVHREALIELVGDGVNIKGVRTASEAIFEVKQKVYDTVVIDLGLVDGSGYEVCEYIKNSHPQVPIIIYTGKELSKEDQKRLQTYSNSIIMKTAHSNERILNEINLFLHREQQAEEKPSVSKKTNFEGGTILIVDDDITNIFVLEAYLEECNTTTLSAFNGQEALDLLAKNNEIDLILMDIMMPVMDGYEAMTAIRKDENLKHIPIIAVTAKVMQEDLEKCFTFGANDYMSKPIDPQKLNELLLKWSGKKV